MGDTSTQTVAIRDGVPDGAAAADPDTTASDGGDRGRHRLTAALGAAARHLGVIAVFVLPGIVLWWHTWTHPTAAVTCACPDAEQQVWFIGWPAYALSHGLNPFFSHVIWAPNGINLLNNASMPLVGTVLAPITWAWGAVVANNVAITLAPALTAWAAWVACRQFVTWPVAPWMAGLLFGYSPWVISSLREGHLGLALLVVPPLVLVVLNQLLVRQAGPAWRWGVALGLLLTAQFLISVEVLTMMAVVAVIGVVATMALGPSHIRARLPYAAAGLGVGAALIIVLLAWPAWFMSSGPRHLSGPVWPGLHYFGNRVSPLWDPTVSAPTTSLGYAGGPPAEYLGIGTLVAAVVSVVLAWRRRVTWLLVVVVLASLWLSVGALLYVTQNHTVNVPWLPWKTVANWPILDDILPGRFTMFADLGIALLIAIGLDEFHARVFHGRVGRQGRRLRPVVVVVGLAVAVAAVFVPIWGRYDAPVRAHRLAVPAWFTTVGRTIPPGATVLTYPFPTSSSYVASPMAWQAAEGMRFRLVGGYAKVPDVGGHALATGRPGTALHALIALTIAPAGSVSPVGSRQDIAALRSALQRWGVSYVVITTTGTTPIDAAAVMTAATGRLPSVSHGAWVWDLRHRPLSGTFDAGAAATALSRCRASAPPPADAAGAGSTPQALNRCVVRAPARSV